MTADGVHRTHCCARHGCKYGDDAACPVARGDLVQDHPCERCQDDDEEARLRGDHIEYRVVIECRENPCPHDHTLTPNRLPLPATFNEPVWAAEYGDAYVGGSTHRRYRVQRRTVSDWS